MILYVFAFLIYTDLIINQEIRTYAHTHTDPHEYVSLPQ
jgi:hypothetical protein